MSVHSAAEATGPALATTIRGVIRPGLHSGENPLIGQDVIRDLSRYKPNTTQFVANPAPGVLSPRLLGIASCT